MKSGNLFLRVFVIAFMMMAGLAVASDNQTHEQIFTDGLGDSESRPHDAAASLDGKLTGLYFSASWCRGCTAFSRLLVPFRNAHADKFEVILLGFDKSSAEMLDYMKNYEMSWLAVPWESPTRLALKERFKVSDIPTLIFMAPDGRVLSMDGYHQVVLMGDEALAHWLKLASDQNENQSR
jgi:nucleoredoxin